MRRAIAVHLRGQWPENRTVDTVTLAYQDRHRRRIRLVADSGAAFLLDLPRAQHFARDVPFVFTNLKTGEGLDRIVDFMITQGGL